jgi:hypothetical protein
LFLVSHAAFSLCDTEKLIKSLDPVIFSAAALGKAEPGKDGNTDAVRPKELMRGALNIALSIESIDGLGTGNKAWSLFLDKIKASRELAPTVEQIRQEINGKVSIHNG